MAVALSSGLVGRWAGGDAHEEVLLEVSGEAEVRRDDRRVVARVARVASRFDLVIFDCDGVLVDSERISVQIDRRVMAEFGIQISEAEVIERFMGRSEGTMIQAIEAHLGRAVPADWDEGYEAMYRTAFEAELAPVDGVLDALDAITQPTCVASSSQPDGLRYKLELCGLLQRFGDRVFSAAQVKNGKPAPDLFLFAADRLGVNPSRCVVIEDSPYGVQAARAAGMHALAYAAGMVPVRALAGPGTTVFKDMRKLPALLDAVPD